MDTLICYDIADDRRRQRVANVLLDFGKRVQESVFWAELDEGLEARLLERLRGVMEETEDSVLLVPVCGGCRKQIVELGKADVPEVKDYYVL